VSRVGRRITSQGINKIAVAVVDKGSEAITKVA